MGNTMKHLQSKAKRRSWISTTWQHDDMVL